MSDRSADEAPPCASDQPGHTPTTVSDAAEFARGVGRAYVDAAVPNIDVAESRLAEMTSTLKLMNEMEPQRPIVQEQVELMRRLIDAARSAPTH